MLNPKTEIKPPCEAAQSWLQDRETVDSWFSEKTSKNGTVCRFSAVEFGIVSDRPDILQTGTIQQAIDAIAEKGGGTLSFPAGIYLSGSVFFRPGVHLHLEKDAVLLGSQSIDDFALLPTRLEGKNINYFAALVNADYCNGFRITGEGILDGNGLPYWRHFWLRRKFNPACTNLDEMRPRILYISNSDDVTIKGITIRNSPFWSTHYYRCRRLTLENLWITAPTKPVKAPSSDAVDLDNCEYVHIRDSYFSVNDDAIALKGGKGYDAARRPENGMNSHILIENCKFGFCHSCLTCGSETIHNQDIVMRNCEIDGADTLFHLKMRPDTPQKNEYIHLADIRGFCNGEVFVFDSWTQFRETEEILPSIGEHILAERLDMACKAIIYITDGEDEFHISDIRIRDSWFHTDDPIAKEYKTLIKFENVKNTQNRKNNPALQKKTLPSGD